MSQPDSDYVLWVSARVVNMFERFARNIDTDDPEFIEFIQNYVQERQVREPRKVPYVELYKVIKEGVRQYLALKVLAKEGASKSEQGHGSRTRWVKP